jgi:hypothetical protein
MRLVVASFGPSSSIISGVQMTGLSFLIDKLRWNEPLSSADLDALEILVESGAGTRTISGKRVLVAG